VPDTNHAIETDVTDSTAELYQWLLFIGDTNLILSHRVSEWCGHAPALEEDIALANTALDLLGQAQLWLELAGQFDEQKRTADQLAFLRDANAFRNALLVELPNNDFGCTLMRQFLFDAWHFPVLQALVESSDERIAAIAEKASREVAYHLERSSDLVIRLGDGSDTSHQYMQAALDYLWCYTGELCAEQKTDSVLIADGIVHNPVLVAEAVHHTVSDTLSMATLRVPESEFMQTGGRAGVHTEHLGFLLAEMQFLQRTYPGSTW